MRSERRVKEDLKVSGGSQLIEFIPWKEDSTRHVRPRMSKERRSQEN